MVDQILDDTPFARQISLALSHERFVDIVCFTTVRPSNLSLEDAVVESAAGEAFDMLPFPIEHSLERTIASGLHWRDQYRRSHFGIRIRIWACHSAKSEEHDVTGGIAPTSLLRGGVS
jgi:hypothetical protein